MKKVLFFVTILVLCLFTLAHAWVTATKRNSTIPGYQYYKSIAAGADGEVVWIPPLEAGTKITCRIHCGVGTGYIKYTTSPDEFVKDGTATWTTWPKGEQTGTAEDVIISPVSGLQGFNTGAAALIIEILY